MSIAAAGDVVPSNSGNVAKNSRPTVRECVMPSISHRRSANRTVSK
jgi:hypothetical protein